MGFAMQGYLVCPSFEIIRRYFSMDELKRGLYHWPVRRPHRRHQRQRPGRHPDRPGFRLHHPRAAAPPTASRACWTTSCMTWVRRTRPSWTCCKYTPSSALGSCRYKMADPDEDDTDYQRILEIFKKYDVRYFFYNGGNDSMDTCNKISQVYAEGRLRVPRHGRAQDHRQRPVRHRPLPRLRLRRQVHRHAPAWRCIRTPASTTPA